MDSLSQFALGAAVGVAVMGRRTPVWKAALWGGVCGTLPDLDALIDHGDPVSNMTLHRAETHALFWQTLAAPLIAAVAGGLRGWREGFGRRLIAVWLILVTHALLDAMTVYGTQLALPFSNHPYGVGSLFIIDPLYTLPLLLGLGLALRGGGRRRWNLAGLTLSSAYLGWSVLAQAHVGGLVQQQLQAASDAPAPAVLVTPAPFNTVLWRVLVMRDTHYEEGFHSLLDPEGPIRFRRFPLDQEAQALVAHLPAVQRIAWFSRGFSKVHETDGLIRITDLRMGQEPFYSFSFGVARRASAPVALQTPISVGGREGVDLSGYFKWLGRRALGEPLDPP